MLTLDALPGLILSAALGAVCVVGLHFHKPDALPEGSIVEHVALCTPTDAAVCASSCQE